MIGRLGEMTVNLVGQHGVLTLLTHNDSQIGQMNELVYGGGMEQW
jgi:hypothetical protein